MEQMFFLIMQEELVRLGKARKPQKTIYARLLARAAHALAEVLFVSRRKWVDLIVDLTLQCELADFRDRINPSQKICGLNPILLLPLGNLVLSSVTCDLVVSLFLSLSLFMLVTFLVVASYAGHNDIFRGKKWLHYGHCKWWDKSTASSCKLCLLLWRKFFPSAWRPVFL